MRKLTGAAFISLDGVMQAPGAPTEDPTGDFEQGGWVFGVGDDVIDPVLGRLFNPPYALLLGRRTYDIFAAYWPFIEGEMAGMGQALTAADKYVMTHVDQPLVRGLIGCRVVSGQCARCAFDATDPAADHRCES